MKNEENTDNTNVNRAGKASLDLSSTFLSSRECWHEKKGNGSLIGRLQMAASIVL